MPESADPRDRLIVALDLPDVAAAERLVARIGDAATFYKIGYRLAYAGGLDFAARLAREGKKTFLDLKLHDIGNTVEEGVRSASALGASFLTVHAYPQTMRAAVRGRGQGLKILAVTVLTSYDDADAAEAGYALPVADLVAQRASQAAQIGIDGIVCSAAEARAVRERIGPSGLIVTPGIRPAGAEAGDQKRVMTPGQARAAGIDHVVVGRPITGAEDPRAVARNIVAEMENVVMAKGYWIVRVDVSDAEAYKAYAAANGAAFARFGGRFLVRGGAFEAVAGQARARNVVVEFPSYEDALACWNSDLYQSARALQKGGAEADILVIEGYDGPQPVVSEPSPTPGAASE